jgi:hypothetical protein
MNLNKNHREALINQLVSTKDEIILSEPITRNEFTEDFKDWRNIKLFLLKEKVRLIEKCLIDNEIDL